MLSLPLRLDCLLVKCKVRAGPGDSELSLSYATKLILLTDFLLRSLYFSTHVFSLLRCFYATTAVIKLYHLSLTVCSLSCLYSFLFLLILLLEEDGVPLLCCRFLAIKREFFLSTVILCLLMGDYLIVGVLSRTWHVCWCLFRNVLYWEFPFLNITVRPMH